MQPILSDITSIGVIGLIAVLLGGLCAELVFGWSARRRLCDRVQRLAARFQREEQQSARRQELIHHENQQVRDFFGHRRADSTCRLLLRDLASPASGGFVCLFRLQDADGPLLCSRGLSLSALEQELQIDAALVTAVTQAPGIIHRDVLQRSDLWRQLSREDRARVGRFVSAGLCGFDIQGGIKGQRDKASQPAWGLWLSTECADVSADEVDPTSRPTHEMPATAAMILDRLTRDLRFRHKQQDALDGIVCLSGQGLTLGAPRRPIRRRLKKEELLRVHSVSPACDFQPAIVTDGPPLVFAPSATAADEFVGGGTHFSGRHADRWSMLSHDLSSSLAGLLGLTQRLDDTPLTDEQREYLRLIEQVGREATDYVDQGTGRAAMGLSDNVHPRCDAAPLAASIADAVRPLAPQAHEKNLELILDIDPAIDITGTVESALRRIAINLVRNAIRFTTNGQIRVEATQESIRSLARGRQAGEMIHLSVADTGRGIDRDDQPRVFDAAFQCDTSDSRTGHGLGLAICRQLADRLGGRLAVQSVAAQGSRFHCWIPAQTSTVAEQSRPMQPLAGRHVLVASPRVATRAACRKLCEAWGAKVSELTNGSQLCDRIGADAWMGQFFEHRKEDLAIVDVAVFDESDLPRLRWNASELSAESGDCDSPALQTPVVLLTSAASQRNDAEVIDILTGHGLLSLGQMIMPLCPRTLCDLLDTAESLLPAPAMTIQDTSTDDGDAATEDEPSRLRVLIVEDNPVHLMIAGLTVGAAGHEVVAAEDGRVALEMLERELFDVVLMDIRLPHIDGLSATGILRELERTRSTRTDVIAMTAGIDEEDRIAAAQVGIDGFLTKPLSQESFEQELDRLNVRPLAIDEMERRYHPNRLHIDGADDGEPLDVHVHAFLSACDSALTEIRTAINARDGNWLAEVCHSLTARARAAQAEGIVDILLQLQNQGRRHDSTEIDDLYQRLLHKLQLFEAEAIAGVT